MRCSPMIATVLESRSTPFAAALVLGAALVTPALAGGLPDDLDHYITSGMAAWQMPGLSIAVVKDDELVLVKGYGVRQAGRPGRVDADTIFGIGSATKAFTSAAIGTLVDRETLDWDDHVVDHWPAFAMEDPWITKEIRVSDLLANHSGLSALSEELWYGTDYDREQLIERLAKVPVTEGFRYRFQYRNLMFLAAGQMIPELVGLSWDDYLARTILDPLHMERTTTRLADIAHERNVARPHIVDYEGDTVAIPFRNIENVGPAGSMLSTARDLGNWIRMLSSGGVFDGEEILEPDTLEYIIRSHTPLPTGSRGPSLPVVELPSYALSWIAELYDGRRVIWHNGDIDGIAAWVGFVPDLKLGIAILSNLDGGELRRALFYRIIDSYTGHEPNDLDPGLLERRHAALEARNAAEDHWQALDRHPLDPALPPEAYAGTYTNPAFGEVEMVVEDGQLVYHRTRTMVLDLRCCEEDDNTFLGKYRPEGPECRKAHAMTRAACAPHDEHVASKPKRRISVYDLREGKLKVAFATENGKVTGFSEGVMSFEAVD